ncbi:unnamed protein product [Orchesella dallaii]|uniref:Uncharacterized protein n=1 Tax=Orchesella dallaii TaxID=48710 RepID=A0ABP1RKD3_9HEXA
MSAMEAGATEEISETNSLLFDAVRTWVIGQCVLGSVVRRLFQEIHDLNQQDPLERLDSVIDNPAMQTYMEHIATLAKPYFTTLGKLREFIQRLKQFNEMMKDESTKLDEPGAPTLTVDGVVITMIGQDINQTIEKWTSRNKLLPAWNTTMAELVAEWDSELKLEIQESHSSCVFLLDALDAM